MTIALCVVTPEGVVLGADSTSTRTIGDAQRYLNNEQKLFELGESGRIGVVTWGLGGFGPMSHRTLIAKVADAVAASPAPTNVEAVAKLFSATAWAAYDTFLTPQKPEIVAKQAIVSGGGTQDEKDKAAAWLQDRGVGFCLAGHCLPGREPEAWSIDLTPALTALPTPQKVAPLGIWGSNLFIYKALGADDRPMREIVASKKWTGSPQELQDIFVRQRLTLSLPLPLRETVDLIHAMIHMTIKLMKFTSIPPICGGHIEIATITTDRGFRWVRHKTLGAALDHP